MDEEKKRSPFDNALVAFVIAFAVLSIVGYGYRDLWVYLFSAAVAWVASDFAINLIVRGGSGLAKIPLWGNQIQTKGRSYLAFCFGIFFATAGSAFFSDALFKMMEFGVKTSVTAAGVTLAPYQTEWTTILVSSFVCSVLVFVDFNSRFYGREERKE
jgi:hypothetical protein